MLDLQREQGLRVPAKAAFSNWRLFPDPRKGEYLWAPFGPGCYDLRERDTGRLVLFGSGGNVCERMASLLPAPFGTGTRKNAAKREYVLRNLGRIEYRTLACADRKAAKQAEVALSAGDYLFKT